MRKSKWLVALLVSVIALTGCGKTENVEDVINTAGQKMRDLSNYAMKMEMNVGIKASGLEMTVPMTIDAKIDVKSETAQMNMAIEMMGMKMSTEGYVQTEEGKTTTYTKEMMGDTWTKEYSDDKTGFNDVMMIADNFSKIEKKKSNDKSANCYKATISKDKMDSFLSAMSTDNMEGYSIEKDVVIDVYVDKKSNYITKLVMDLKDVMEADEEVEITAATITITFSDFDQVGTITIPEEVITNAVEESDDMDDFDLDDSDIDM